MEISASIFIIICLGVLLTGMAKSGVVGASCIIVPFLAMGLGGKEAAGFLLPISLTASFISASKNKDNINWKALLKILPWAIIGIILGVFLGKVVQEKTFFIVLASVILIGCTITIIQHFKLSAFKDPLGFSVIIFGILAGFSAMIGNITGPLISTLFLLQRFPKKQFIDTYVWFCFITDAIKVPFHIFIWHTITRQTLLWNLYTLPIMFAGIYLGFWLIKVLPDKIYKYTVIVLSCIAAFILLIR